jgi:hypothetical protein
MRIWCRLGLLCLTTALMAGCAHEPESARDFAEEIGCSKIHAIQVPQDWADFDEAVECSLEGARFAVYWQRGAKLGSVAGECLGGGSEACDRAMAAFTAQVNEDVIENL